MGRTRNQDLAAPKSEPESKPPRYATRSRTRIANPQINEPALTEFGVPALSSTTAASRDSQGYIYSRSLLTSSPDPISAESASPNRNRTAPTVPPRRSRRLKNATMYGFANDDPFDLTFGDEVFGAEDEPIVLLDSRSTSLGKRTLSDTDSDRKRARTGQSGLSDGFGSDAFQDLPNFLRNPMDQIPGIYDAAAGPSNLFQGISIGPFDELSAELTTETSNHVQGISIGPFDELSAESTAEPSEELSTETSTAMSTELSTELSAEPSAEPSAESTEHETTPTRNTNDAENSMEDFRRMMPMRRRRYRGSRACRETLRWKLKQQHPKLLTMWDDLEKMAVIEPKEAPQPTGISRRLKPFQRQGLNWMMEMEKTKWKGGLLGDEMGLGKTIQAVSLIMSDFPMNKPSLVLVPPVALMQWVTEIESYTNGKLRTFVYHNSRSEARNITVEKLLTYDVIMMSYNSLESLYRRQMVGTRRGPRDEEPTMVKKPSPIHEIEFHRVILDEAHEIKTRTTSTAKACFALKSTYRWCLSGTPLQNRIGELFSLLRFVNIEPFASYFCTDCKCESLEWSMDKNKECTLCGCRSMAHLSIFNQELLNPIQKHGTQGLGAEAFRKLRLLTDRLMLRRQKKDHMEAMELPVKEMRVSREFFGDAEKDLANSIMGNSQRKFDTYVARGVLLNNYANIFGLIMQMRQVADHPDLILRRKGGEVQDGVIECAICEQPAEDAIRSNCHHHYCRMCVTELVASSPECSCMRCHIPLVIDLEQEGIEQDPASMKHSSIVNRISMENWTSSTKIELLLHELYMLRSDSQTVKVIIFSQFTSMLQLIEWRLRHAGFTTVMLDGSMTPAQRAASIKHFMENVDVECFLVSLKAGGVALNLTEASRVFLIEPWWNPAVEWQSADRCHRIGQSRPCTITNLVIEDSVESRMVLLQEKKARMIRSTINHDKEAMDSLTPQDLMFLFRGN